MTIAAPRCTCESLPFPDFGRPCPVHGSKHTKMMLDAQTTASARLKAENDRLRELYENAVGNRERFGWTINHLLECEDALAHAQAEAAEANAAGVAEGRAAGRDEALREVVAWLRARKARGWDYPSPDTHAAWLADAIEAAFPTTGGPRGQ